MTFRLTWDGIKRKQKFESEVDVLETNIKSEIDTFYEKNLDNKARINRLTVIENSCANNDKFKKWEKEKRYYQSLPNFLLSIGLLGTFTGIAVNLFLIGNNIAGKIELQTILPGIISSMAIAFISSLVSLGCSIF